MESTTLTLKRYFKEYYFRHSGRIKAPSEIESREFGYLPFESGMVRHLSFKDVGALRALLVKEAPAGVYCSNSLYHDPTFEMHKKGWMRAELIFDIDADSLKLPCKKEHDIWMCKQCGRKEFGLRPETCPSCGSNRILESSWACPICVEGTKRETFRLLDFLESDFGISRSHVQIAFSGNAGYHLMVAGSEYENLDQRGRAEISDYLTAQGIMPRIFKTEHLAPKDPGWKGRVAKRIRDLPPGTPPFRHDEYEKRLHELITVFKDEKADEFLTSTVKAEAVRIDAMVTTDIHRIFRMPETLNQKTGLVKRECKDLSSFDPLTEAIALKDNGEPIEIQIDVCPKIELGGNSYGPFRNESKRLPPFVAVYLIAKGAAKIASEGILSKVPTKAG